MHRLLRIIVTFCLPPLTIICNICAIISIHRIQRCGGVVCNASSGVSSLFCSRSTFFRVNLILSTNSYFESAVAATDDPCIPIRWIGVHKDTHFVLVFSITTLCGDLFQRISHLFRYSLSCIEGGMMCICYSPHHEFVDWSSCHSCASVDFFQLRLEGHFSSCISLFVL